MTGFGFGEYQDDLHQLVLELKCYNNRYLDININMPSSMSLLEPRLRDFLSERIRRGKVELSIRYRQLREDVEFWVDHEAVQGYAAILREMADAASVDSTVQLSHLLRMEDLIKTQRNIDPETIWMSIAPLLESVYQDFEQTRIREGALTKKHIIENIDVLDETVTVFRKSSTQLEDTLKDNLRERFEQVLGNRIDEDRILTETAVLLVKYSIDEEIARLDGHVSAVRQIADQEGPVGKKLDFLCQELNREINTVGSKSTMYELNSRVVNAKDAIEKIREQLRNVE